MALITAAEARLRIPTLTGTAEDSALETLIGAIGRVFARFCAYPKSSTGAEPTMESATYVEDLDGPGGRDLTLPVWPATSITSVYDDPELDFAAASLVSSADYTLLKGRRLRLSSSATHGSWGTQEGCIRVTFVAGYATAPEDLKLAVELAVRNVYDLNKTQGKVSVSQGETSTTYRDEDLLPPAVQTLLTPFILPRGIL